MRRTAGALLATLALAVSCGTLQLPGSWPWAPRPEPPAPIPDVGPVTSDEEKLAWAESEPYFVVARLSCRTLDVYRRGRRIRTYDAVFGMGGSGKRWEGDRRTPLGLYRISRKMPHPRWRHFFLLDYPNASDVLRWEEAVEAEEIPDNGDGEPVGPGGQVGIHGTDKPDDNRRGVDWTFGCISVENRAIEDLQRLLPLGTPVLIQE